jgi:hypothetical protein
VESEGPSQALPERSRKMAFPLRVLWMTNRRKERGMEGDEDFEAHGLLVEDAAWSPPAQSSRR